jgi:hypothetical protein
MAVNYGDMPGIKPLIGALPSLVRTNEPNTALPITSIPTAPGMNPRTGLPWGPGLYASSAVAPTSGNPYQIPVYQVQSQPTGLAPGELQRRYGTAQMPMFEFARKVQTGEVTIDPKSFQAAADSFSGVTDEELQAQGVEPSTKDYIIQTAAGLGQAVVGKAGQMAAQSGQSFSSQLGPAAQSYLPEPLTAPGAIFGGPELQGVQAQQAGLAWNEVGVPLSQANDLRIAGARESGSPMFQADTSGGEWGPETYVPMNKSTVDQAVVRSQIQAGDEYGGFSTGDHIPSSQEAPSGGMFDFGDSFKGYAPSWGQTGMSFGISFAANLASGMKAKDAAKGAVFQTAGMYAGSLIGGPIGGVVGGMIGSYLGGRVVCNELWRQGHMSKEMVLDDYRFTRDFLSPGTVRGYHVWAIPVVRQMRKGRFNRLFKHLCVHRGNEIAYIYGKRDKPDYLGKVYRQLLEKLSWSIGLFCEASDWSILYKEKEV